MYTHTHSHTHTHTHTFKKKIHYAITNDVKNHQKCVLMIPLHKRYLNQWMDEHFPTGENGNVSVLRGC